MTIGDGDSPAWTGERTISVLWRRPDGTWRLRTLDVRGSGPGTEYRDRATGEPVTAAEIRAMAESKRRSELASARAYHARGGR
jgi:hypothetical protein